MKFTYTCKKVSLNDSVKAYAEKKVGKLEKFFKEEPEASVTFSVEKKNRCVAEIMLRGANGTLFRAVCEDPDGDMRGAIDEATAQIERKIRKNKTRLAKNLRAEAVLPELPEEFEAHEEGTFDIVRTKRFTVKPMSVEEAILQMNLLGHSFFVFRNTDFGDDGMFREQARLLRVVKAAQVRLDRVRQRVHAGLRRDVWRQADGQHGV